MIRINKQSDSETIALTLTEALTISVGYYLFVLTKKSIEKKFTFCLPLTDDTSTNKDRYNKFTFIANVFFVEYPIGEYQYKVYETETITEDETGLNELENGRCQIYDNETPYIQEDELTIEFIENE